MTKLNLEEQAHAAGVSLNAARARLYSACKIAGAQASDQTVVDAVELVWRAEQAMRKACAAGFVPGQQ